mmetsp:Transcript_11524/g.18888  ORF Transcript_11524/g.18888 Transcript_11524/m.18888 type:complete len:913 (-) Transcript_11524:6-2744(-)
MLSIFIATLIFIIIILADGFRSPSIRFEGYTQSMPRFTPETNLNAKKAPKKISPNVANYIRMRELKKLQQAGASYEELKEASVNGTASGYQVVGKSYQSIVGKGTLDQRLRAVIAYKRDSLATGGALDIKGESGLTAKEEIELEKMMETDDFDDDDEEDGSADMEDDEEALYESLITKAIEQGKLNEVKRNFMIQESINSAKSDQQQDNISPVGVDAKDDTLDELSSPRRVIGAATTGAGTGSIEDSTTYLSTNTTATTSSNATATGTPPAATSTGTSTVAAATTAVSEKVAAARKDVYKPKVSTWGVFERPKDISKAYGGGRVITKAEMDKMDEEMNARQQEKAQFLTAAQKLEKKNQGKIADSLSRSRVYMQVGNRKAAVEVLETVKDVCSFQTEVGGEIWLELAMALETVERSDEARKIYGKLASVCWSQRIRRSALQLISGLDITQKIRQDLTPAKPVMDAMNMAEVSKALQAGLRNEWDEYKRKDVKFQAWYDDERSRTLSQKNRQQITEVNSIQDAYSLLLDQINPLKEVSAALLVQAVKKLYLASEEERLSFMRERVRMAALSDRSSGPRFKLMNKPRQLQTSTVTVTDPKTGVTSKVTFQGGSTVSSTVQAKTSAPTSTSTSTTSSSISSSTSTGGYSSISSTAGGSTNSRSTISSSITTSTPTTNSATATSKSNGKTKVQQQQQQEQEPRSIAAAFGWVESSSTESDADDDEDDDELFFRTITAGSGSNGVEHLQWDVNRPTSEMYVLSNGTWDLVSSIRDLSSSSAVSVLGVSSQGRGRGGRRSQGVAQNFETGDLRRSIDLLKRQSFETNPVMWGLSTVTRRYAIVTTPAAASVMEVSLQGDDLKQSPTACWQIPGTSQQSFEITYCDSTLMVTRQVHPDIGKPDLYLLWKRKKDTVWKKY